MCDMWICTCVNQCDTERKDMDAIIEVCNPPC